MNDIKRRYLTLVCMLSLIAGLVWPQFVRAGTLNIPKEQAGGALPANVETGLSYLLQLVLQKEAAFVPESIMPLLDFVAQGGYDAEQLQPAQRTSGNGACLRTEIKAPLERILHYAYNPRIPSFVVFPSMLRLSGWYPQSDIITHNAEIWNKLPSLDKPLLLWGKEYEVNTPDLFSGAYYRYDLNRLIILMKHNNKKVLISVSKMPNRSEVGKKAVIIDDKNWNYFYSGIKGLNLKLIGPMETYIYDSASVQVVYETDPARPRTVCMLFKWLKAGWADINLVKHSHIYEGSVRCVEGFKQVMESGDLPDSNLFAKKLEHIKALSEGEFDAKIRDYAINFERIAKQHKGMSLKNFAHIIEDGGYADVLSREERYGVLALEFLKQQLGKKALVQFDFSLPSGKTLAKTRPEFFQGTFDSL